MLLWFWFHLIKEKRKERRKGNFRKPFLSNSHGIKGATPGERRRSLVPGNRGRRRRGPSWLRMTRQSKGRHSKGSVTHVERLEATANSLSPLQGSSRTTLTISQSKHQSCKHRRTEFRTQPPKGRRRGRKLCRGRPRRSLAPPLDAPAGDGDKRATNDEVLSPVRPNHRLLFLRLPQPHPFLSPLAPHSLPLFDHLTPIPRLSTFAFFSLALPLPHFLVSPLGIRSFILTFL